MKKKILSVTLLIVYTVAMIVTISFAWMIQDAIDTVHYVNVDYSQGSGNKLTVSPTEIDMEIWGVDKNGELVNLKNDQALIMKDVVPNEAKMFRIRFRNRTQSVVRVNLIMDNVITTPNITDITPETPTGTLLDVVAVSIRGGTGYINKPIAFPAVYKYLYDQSVYFTGSGKYMIPLLEMLEIPPTGEDDYVELNCYIMLDGSVGNEYENKSMVIGTFRAEK